MRASAHLARPILQHPSLPLSGDTRMSTAKLSLADRSFNRGLDHGSLTGVVAKRSVASLKRGATTTFAITTNYTQGFAKGVVAGWKAA